MRGLLALVFCVPLLSCAPADPNARPIYGKESGLPANCRAYVQAVIDGYRTGKYSADESMAGLERNCGIAGSSWGQPKE